MNVDQRYKEVFPHVVSCLFLQDCWTAFSQEIKKLHLLSHKIFQAIFVPLGAIETFKEEEILLIKDIVRPAAFEVRNQRCR